MRIYCSIIYSVVLLGLVFSSYGAENKLPLGAGETAPTFSLPTVDGQREVLSVWCGTKLSKPYVNDRPHTVILSFWATYCLPCKKEIPELTKFYEKNKGQDLKIFLINIDRDGVSAVLPYMKEHGVTLPVLLDPYNRTAERYNVKSLPALVVIDPDGIIKYSSVGYREDVSLDSILTEVLNAVSEKREVVALERVQGESIEITDSQNLEGASKDERQYKEDVASMDQNALPQDRGGKKAAGEEHEETNAQMPAQVKPRERWRAVALVECGNSVEDVAEELGVDAQVVRVWYQDLKRAALRVWNGESGIEKDN